ncbi:thioredoxin family protein [Sporichthya sp.]|uniref:thioredoxin family protein n=1 Tax=Sporichthya sp. TaxID=65475 RepID=UPI00185B2CF6|nr:thioredoxin family protein [Sporichthya sp.]MBA3741621.1 alkylmercury lyase [Sporichthya sp.]
MKVQVLHVADCPNAELLARRAQEVLAALADVTVSLQLIVDHADAVVLGMHGSPTLLVDGRDPFPRTNIEPSVSCRLYRDEHGDLRGAPSINDLRQVLLAGLP